MYFIAILRWQQIHYTFDIIYLACDKGFHGINCDTICKYPTYGQDCQSVCKCDVPNCDHVNGCRESTKSKIHYHVSWLA